MTAAEIEQELEMLAALLASELSPAAAAGIIRAIADQVEALTIKSGLS